MNRTLLLLPAVALAFGACPSTKEPAEVPTTTAPTVASVSDATSAPPSVADPGFLAQYSATFRFRLGHPQRIRPTRDGKILFLRSPARNFANDLYEYDPATQTERVLLTAAQLLDGRSETLSDAEKARRERMRMAARGIATFSISPAGSGEDLLVPLSGTLYLFDRETREVRIIPHGDGYPLDPQLSPDGTHVAYVIDGDLYITRLDDGTRTRLTTRSADTITHGLSEFVAQEEMGRYHGYWWAPDGQTLLVQQTDERNVELFSIQDPRHPEKPAVPARYPRPGKENAVVRLALVPIDGSESRWVEWDSAAFPYLATVRWQTEGPPLLVVQNRRQTEMVILTIEVQTGDTTSLHTERDAAWLNIEQAVPRWVDDGKALLWQTEREGGPQLELRDAEGGFLRALTRPDLGLQGIVSAEDDGILVRASAEPTETQIYRVSLDAKTTPAVVYGEPGVAALIYEADSPYYVVQTESASEARRYRVRATKEDADAGTLTAVAEAPGFVPTPQFVDAPVEQAFRSVIVRPRNFDPDRRYPVIVSVYGGPHYQVVQQRQSRYVLHQWIADHGFIVISADGRGTPGRGRDWERVINNDLIAVPLDDQVTALQALGKTYPEMDLDRVGVYGWSFGGYFSLHAVMQRPDVFHAAVAGAPVTDWRNYDTHYTERYIGLPDDPGGVYDKTSVMTYADTLERPLLLIHGTADDNVYFMHSLELMDALFRAGKTADFLPLSDFTHMVTDPLVNQRLWGRIMSFFQTNLATK
ncbi:MAG: dipeptidyl-peptidase-4 [Myxococcota bacterium]|jgi:dipeptidyl-peptidase-4